MHLFGGNEVTAAPPIRQAAGTAPTLLIAPVVFGAKTSGIERGGDALMNQGLGDFVHFTNQKRVETAGYVTAPAEGSRYVTRESIGAYIQSLDTAITNELNAGLLPVVLGGDDTIVLAAAQALSTRGSCGIFWCGGPQLEPRGGIDHPSASLLLRNTMIGSTSRNVIEGIVPPVKADHVVLFGVQPSDENADIAKFDDVREAEKLIFDTSELEVFGFEDSFDNARSKLLVTGPDGFWLHISADSLSELIIPHETSPKFTPLNISDLARCLQALQASHRMLGLSVSGYNPSIDTDGYGARALNALLGTILT